MHLALVSGYTGIAEILLRKGAPVEAKDKNCYTPLHLAARGGYGSVVELLLKKRAPVEAKDKDGHTPLHLAARSGHGSVVQLLLGRGARLELRVIKVILHGILQDSMAIITDTKEFIPIKTKDNAFNHRQKAYGGTKRT